VLLAGAQVRKEAHVVGVVGNHEEIERPRQARRRPVGRDDFITSSETIPIVEAEPVSERAGVHRDVGVQMGVTPKWPARKTTLRVG